VSPNFNGDRPEILDQIFKIHIYLTFSAIKFAYQSSELEDSAAKEKKEKKTSVVR